ncbi:hypothetical protein [Scopulibacillus cellulosilyticus]|uniref:Uncharacterized protein n=1 Tax=Scopulibacillus cellulosilyticus TaxID=2665665 RepID=A0ABW2Q2R3_9BACL
MRINLLTESCRLIADHTNRNKMTITIDKEPFEVIALKLNRLVFLFRYYPNKGPKKYISLFFGILGTSIGIYIWLSRLPQFYGDDMTSLKHIQGLDYTIFLFIPSSIALISVLFNKTYLMYLAALISLPIILFVGLHPLSIYCPLLCYLISILITFKKSLTKKDKEELEKLITEQVKEIEKEAEEQLTKAQSVISQKTNILHTNSSSEPTSYHIVRTYQANLNIANKINQNYKNYVKSRGSAFANTYRLGVFYLLTRTNGIWDLKQTIGEKTKYRFKGQKKQVNISEITILDIWEEPPVSVVLY